MSKKVETEKKNVVVRRNKTGVKIAEHINLLSIAKLDLDLYSKEEIGYLLDLAVADLAKFNEYIVKYNNIEIE